MRMTMQEFLDHQARHAKAKPQPSDAAEREVGKGGLQEQIVNFCKACWPPWVCVWQRTDKPTTTARGVCDFIIGASGGRTFWVETKSKTGKRTAEQEIFAHQLRSLGHTCHLVRSMTEFLTTVRFPDEPFAPNDGAGKGK